MNPLIDRIPACRTLKFPGFVTGWMITDIVLTSLQLLSSLSISALLTFMAPETFSFLPALIYPVCCFGLVLCGYPAAIGLLCKRRWALFFGRLTIAFNLLSLIVMLALILLAIPAFLTTEPCAGTIFILWIAAAIPCFLIRTALLVFYWIAVVRAGRFFRNRGF